MDFNSDQIFDSLLFILNGIKVMDKSDRRRIIMNDGDFVLIAPLVAGG
jgi:hypothetical protein